VLQLLDLVILDGNRQYWALTDIGIQDTTEGWKIWSTMDRSAMDETNKVKVIIMRAHRHLYGFYRQTVIIFKYQKTLVVPLPAGTMPWLWCPDMSANPGSGCGAKSRSRGVYTAGTHYALIQ
jgi:hypothetical protein